MKKNNTLRTLRDQLKAVKKEREKYKVKLDLIQKEYESRNKTVKTLEETIKNAGQKKSITVSDHARLRYLERVRGIDIDQMDREILNDKTVSLIRQLGGNGTYPNADFCLKLNDYTVVTIITNTRKTSK